jgi:hypothetical protein
LFLNKCDLKFYVFVSAGSGFASSEVSSAIKARYFSSSRIVFSLSRRSVLHGVGEFDISKFIFLMWMVEYPV